MFNILLFLSIMNAVVAAPALRPTMRFGLGSLSCAALSPDGSLFATGGSGGIYLWSAHSGERIADFLGHEAAITSIAFSNDGQRVLTGSKDQTARLWETQTGKVIRIFSGHILGVRSVAFSFDGNYVLTGGDDNIAILWNPDNGNQVRRYVGHSNPIFYVTLSLDGTKVFSSDYSDLSVLWNRETGTELRRFSSKRRVALSQDASQILLQHEGIPNQVDMFNVNTGGIIRSYTFNSGHDVTPAAFTPDGSNIILDISYSTVDPIKRSYNYVKMVDSQTESIYKNFFDPTEWNSSNIKFFSISQNGTGLLTGSTDRKKIMLWDTDNAAVIRSVYGFSSSPVYCVAVSHDGTKAVSGNGDGVVNLWNLGLGISVRTYSLSAKPVTSVSFSFDDTKVLISHDKTALLFSADLLSQISTFVGHTAEVTGVAFSRNGRKILTASADHTAKLWNSETGSVIQAFSGHTDRVTSVCFSPDETRVLTGSWDNTAILWDSQTGSDIRTFSGHTDWISTVAFSTDGTQVLTGSLDGTARVWDVETGLVSRTLIGQIAGISSAAFSPDGSKVITAGMDKTANLFDVVDATLLSTLRGHLAEINNAVFTQNGNGVLTSSSDGTILSWDVAASYTTPTPTPTETPTPSPTPVPQSALLMAY